MIETTSIRSTNTKPQINLDYSNQTHEFTIRVSNVAQVKYTLEYDVETEDGSKKEAIFNQSQADNKNNFTQSHVAGTQSNQDWFYHTVLKGKLNITTTDTDNKTENQVIEFTINENQELIIVESNEATHSAEVLGASTSAETELLISDTKTIAQTQTTQTPVAQTLEATPTEGAIGQMSSYLLMGALGITLVTGSIVGILYWRKKNQMQQSDFQKISITKK